MAIIQKLVILIVIGLAISSSNAEECQIQDSLCECTYKDGTGFSLKKLLSPSDTHMEAINEQNLTFFFNPCMNSKDLPAHNVTSPCDNGYMLCVYNIEFKNFTMLGNKDDAVLGEKNGKMYINFGAKTSDNHSTVMLECTPNAADDSNVLYAPKESNMIEAHLTLFSKLSCMQQIYEVKEPGFFGTFFLVLFIMFFCYLVLGMMYQYFLVGARGFEILPNYDFWCKIWISIKLGFLYLKNGCKVIPADDSYDAI